MLIRGRRRVGKSRLVEEFVDHIDVPHLYFAASGRPIRDELRLFAQEVATSDLPGTALFDGVELSDWDAALRLLATVLPDDGSVVVLDEVPYLAASDKNFEGSLQRAFDRELARKRVLLIGIGSDLAMMEALNEYGRPFHQRATEMIVPPLTPYEVGSLLELPAADAIDAYLVTGGLPLICNEWQPRESLWDYLREATGDPTSALLVSAERSLAAEFPSDAQARAVLGVIGSGERTFTNIGRAADAIPHGSLSFLGPRLGEIERGRGDRVLARVRTSWTSWRGRAIEPLVRDALERLAPPVTTGRDDVPGVVGGYWTRTNNPEIDLVVADRAPIAKHIIALGSIKWLENSPFDSHDLGQLHAHRTQLPGAAADTPMIAVARSGCAVDDVVHIGPEDLVKAYE